MRIPQPGCSRIADSFLHEMPVYLKEMDAWGIKRGGGYPANRERELPVILGVQVMNSAETRVPYCIMDCRRLTGARTAAVAGVLRLVLRFPSPFSSPLPETAPSGSAV